LRFGIYTPAYRMCGFASGEGFSEAVVKWERSSDLYGEGQTRTVQFVPRRF
jgi:hypothetical protein